MKSTEMSQVKHNTKQRDSRLPRKVNNQYVNDLMKNIQDDSTEPKKIPVIVNGCTSETRAISAVSKNEEVYSTQNTFSDLYGKLLDNKTSTPIFTKHKVLLIGDSHLRGYSENMKLYLNDQFQVSGFIKPGAETKTILEQTTKEIDNLLSTDFIILSCGSNDIGRVRLNVVLSDIIGFIKKVIHTKVILLTIPVRHDLRGANISINKEITKFNKRLCKMAKLYSHLSVLEIDENRQYYTKHGLHLNGLG